MDFNVAIDEALKNVNQLERLGKRLTDEQPFIEAFPASVTYTVNLDTNFEDREAFVTGFSKYLEEATVQSDLNLLLEEGEKHAVMLYTWRCISKAIPSVKDDSDPRRLEIYEKTIQVMEREIGKLIEFYYFFDRAKDKFCQEITNLCHPQKIKDFISETHLVTLGQLINMFAVLDQLKDIKASISNDFTHYKRIDSLLGKQGMNEDRNMLYQQLTMFLAGRRVIMDSLFTKLSTIENYEEVLAEIVNTAARRFEMKCYMTPKEKHMLLKVVAFGLFLIDGPANKSRGDKKGPSSRLLKMNDRSLSIQRFDRLFKTLPVVPLYGDMHINVYLCPRDQRFKSYELDPGKWTCVNKDVVKVSTTQFNIVNKLQIMRQEYERITAELMNINGSYKNQYNISEGEGVTQNTSAPQFIEVFELAKRGIQFLCECSATLMELYVWKLSNPRDKRELEVQLKNNLLNEETEGPIEEKDFDIAHYERATKYNYTPEEKSAFVEVISIIKSTAALMKRMEVVFSEGIARCVHLEVQDFVQRRLRDLLRFSVKRKKQIIRTVVTAIRETCADWINNKEDPNDPAIRGEKDPKTGHKVRIKNRACGLSSTQLYMVRTMVESLISNKAANKKTMKKEMDTQHYTELDRFYTRSYFYKDLLNFGTVLSDCSDLPQFWYREFYLQLEDKIQFPIEMSMPWILTSHILEMGDPSMMEYILFPLDLYNDSANYALSVFKKQFLYDEIEAEVNLCFDQFVYNLSDNIFNYFRQKACILFLDKKFKDDVSNLKIRIPNCQSNRYETILQQRHVQLLGRSVDLNRLIRQRLAIAMHKSIEVAITKFETKDLTGIIELQSLIGIAKLTYQMLSEYVTLDSFDDIFRQANDSVKSPCGKITMHIYDELNNDFLPNFCYNSSTNRFVRTTMAFSEAVHRESHSTLKGVPAYYTYVPKQVSKGYDHIHEVYSMFVGQPHFAAIIDLLGYQGVSLIIEGLLENVRNKLTYTLLNYVLTLKEGMPPELNRPRFEYGPIGVFEFYHTKLESIFRYSELTTNVFQTIREIGNFVLFTMIIEQVMSEEEIMDLLQASPFLGIMPRPVVKDEQNEEVRAMKVEEKVKKMEEQYSSLVLTQIEKTGTPEQVDIARDSMQLAKERLCKNLSILSYVLDKLRSYLSNEGWIGDNPPNGVMYMDECKEFHRLWSAMQLFIAMSPLMSGAGSQNSNEEMFGEGLHWAALTIITILGQQYRFHSLDFSYHLLRVFDEKPKDGISCGISIKKLVDRIRHIQLMNNRILSVLNKYNSSDGSVTSIVPLEEVKYFPPPIRNIQ
ncbi:hypothetical protein ACHWQZ_G009162 [Mnemiopsis leidyi]